MIRILHTNDFHGTLTGAKVEAMRLLRQENDLYFDTGDCVKAGNLAIPLKPEPVWPLLRELDCTGSVIGNRESQILETAFRKKIEGASHPVLCANMRRKDGSHPLLELIELGCKGVRIGVFGVMVPMVTERMATRAASAFLWDQPIATAIQMAQSLRSRCDLLIALTHIGNREDHKLANACPEIDLILGGHSHTVLTEPERIGNTWICQGGSHGRFAGVYGWTQGKGLTSARLATLPEVGRMKGR